MLIPGRVARALDCLKFLRRRAVDVLDQQALVITSDRCAYSVVFSDLVGDFLVESSGRPHIDLKRYEHRSR